MQTNLKEKGGFFQRIMQIIEYKGIASVNKFATEYLGYNSPEKINRLKKEGTSPSYEIILDISNMFEEIDVEWLVTGRGKMLKSSVLKESFNQAAEDAVVYGEGYWKGRYDELLEQYEKLKRELSDIKSRKGDESNHAGGVA